MTDELDYSFLTEKSLSKLLDREHERGKFRTYYGAAFIIPDLCDVVLPGVVYRWFRPIYSIGFGTGDFELEECATHQIGKEPGWWDDNWDGGFTETYIRPCYTRYDSWRNKTPIVDFCAQHGLAHRQPFLLEVREPHWYKTSYEYNEWDCDYEWDFCRALPISLKTTQHRWRRHMQYLKLLRE